MENYEVLNTLWFWIMIALIVVLHIAAAIVRSADKRMLTVVCSVNMIFHFILFGFMLINSATPDELFFALLISTVAALITTRRGRKEKKDGI